jgi:hypothetical protein
VTRRYRLVQVVFERVHVAIRIWKTGGRFVAAIASGTPRNDGLYVESRSEKALDPPEWTRFSTDVDQLNLWVLSPLPAPSPPPPPGIPRPTADLRLPNMWLLEGRKARKYHAIMMSTDSAASRRAGRSFYATAGLPVSLDLEDPRD